MVGWGLSFLKNISFGLFILKRLSLTLQVLWHLRFIKSECFVETIIHSWTLVFTKNVSQHKFVFHVRRSLYNLIETELLSSKLANRLYELSMLSHLTLCKPPCLVSHNIQTLSLILQPLGFMLWEHFKSLLLSLLQMKRTKGGVWFQKFPSDTLSGGEKLGSFGEEFVRVQSEGRERVLNLLAVYTFEWGTLK